MFWYFTLFDGVLISVPEEKVPVQKMDVFTQYVTPEQIEDARTWFNKLWEGDFI